MTTISPYDRNVQTSRKGFIAFLVSLLLHIAALAVFIFLSGMPSQRVSLDNVMYVQLGNTMPAAHAAPKDLPVDHNQNTPDVQEAPKSDPTPPAQPDPLVDNPPVVAPPDDFIPIGKTPEEPPKIQRTPEKPPVVKPPKVVPPKPKPKPTPPKPKPKPQPNLDDEIAKKMAELKRQQEADELAADNPNATHWNTNIPSGGGDGAGSEPTSTTRGERLHPDVERYVAHVKDIVSANWIPQDGESANITASYRVVIRSDGSLESSQLTESSGSNNYDDSVKRAVNMSSPFPPLPPIFNGQSLGVVIKFPINEMRRYR